MQDWKTENYKDTIKSGTVSPTMTFIWQFTFLILVLISSNCLHQVKPRPGVVRLMDSARAAVL